MLLYPTDFIADFHAIMYQPVLLNGYIAPSLRLRLPLSTATTASLYHYRSYIRRIKGVVVVRASRGDPSNEHEVAR